MTTTKYDVFVSYSHRDQRWVKDILVPKLKSWHLRVFTDLDFSVGSFSVEQMAEGVEQSKHTVCVFTEAYFQSEWSKLENVMAQQLDPAAKLRKIIPLLRKDCEIPLRLRVLVYRDLRGDDSVQWSKLHADLTS